MQKQAQFMFRWMSYVLFGISILFYIFLLRAPITFLIGLAVGLIVYGLCYVLIRIGWYKFVRGILFSVSLFIVAYALYTGWYVLQKF